MKQLHKGMMMTVVVILITLCCHLLRVEAGEELSPCPVSEHTCDNLRCVPRDRVCNGYDDCGDNSDEKSGCTPCNATYYGEVGRSYEIALHESSTLTRPFTCHLTFVAAGDIYGDLVQVAFRDLVMGSFKSHHVCGCPGGYIELEEKRLPHISGQWCGGSSVNNVYYSETSTVTITVTVPELIVDQSSDLPFKVNIFYKFLLAAEAIVRFGPWNSAKYLGVVQPGTACDRVFDSCDRRKCRIQSPNFPGIYPRNMTCQYIIRQATVPHGRHALVSVVQTESGMVHIRHTDAPCDDNLHLKLDSDCDVVGDTLTVYDMQGDKQKSLIKFCGGGKVPRITATGSDLLIVFQSSPFDNMHFDASVGTHSGFELEVGVSFVPKNSFLYAEEKCEFMVSSFEASKGHFENIAHSLPRDSKCYYRFKGRPDEVIWLYFTRVKSSYTQPPSRDGPHCRTRVSFVEGLEGDGDVLENTCGHLGVRVCHREQLGPGRNRTRPCGGHESYLTSSSSALLIVHYLLPSAVANMQFRLHYEFVYSGPRAAALTGPDSCDRNYSSERTKKGLITSPSNNLLYGKFGTTNLKCRYTLQGKPNEVIRVTFISFYAHNSSCLATPNSLQACGTSMPLEGRGARLEVSEWPWLGIELPLACLCHGFSLPAALVSFSSSLTISYNVVGMNAFDDFSHFNFELEYEFVEVELCEQERIITGEAGVLSLALHPPPGPCHGRPWLLRPSADKFLMVSVSGRDLQRRFHYEPDDLFLALKESLVSTDCHGSELHIYQPANPQPLSVICVDPNSAETVNVFSQGFIEPWSLDYLGDAARSLVVVMVNRPFYLSVTPTHKEHESVDVRWVEAAPRWLAGRCSTECPEAHACISASLFCDGVWHCPSGSDEAVVTCLLALSPWLWLLFGLIFGSLSVVGGWYGYNFWKRKKGVSQNTTEGQTINLGHYEANPHPPDYPECVDVDFETTV